MGNTTNDADGGVYIKCAEIVTKDASASSGSAREQIRNDGATAKARLCANRHKTRVPK